MGMTNRDIRICIDRFVPDPVRSDAEADALEARPDNLRLDPMGGGGPFAARMALLISVLLPIGERLKVRFLDGEASLRRRVEELAHQWTDHANIGLEFVNDPAADIRISFKREGSWSYIGTVAHQIAHDQPTMNYGWLTPDTDDDEVSTLVLHEFGHALGAIHEHKHPDVDIPWDKEAVYAYYHASQGWSRTQVDRNLFEAYSPAAIRYSRFDRDSIMLYAVPNTLTIGDYEVGWNRVLSAGDKAFFAAQYPKDPKVVQELMPGGPPAKGSIGVHGEIDSYAFTVDQRRRHILATEGPTDVTMGLFGPNDETSLRGFDDDSGKATNARIVRTLEPGRYFVRVQHFHPTGTGGYEVSARAV